MRIVYMDESGVGDVRYEPHLVVAGVMVHADSHWRQTASKLRQCVEDAVGPKRAPTYVCHAKDLWHGNKKCGLGRDEGRALLKRIVAIPNEMKLQVVWGSTDRRIKTYQNKPPKRALQDAHVVAFAHCLVNGEKWMRRNAGDHEIAQMVCEFNDRNRALQKAFSLFKEKRFSRINERLRGVLDGQPLNHFVDTVHFAEKQDAALLQIADACAFVIRGRLAASKSGAALFGMIHQDLYPRPTSLPALAE